jgi:hypothetical protein
LNQTRIKFFDRILTSNPINNISNVWSGLLSPTLNFDPTAMYGLVPNFWFISVIAALRGACFHK